MGDKNMGQPGAAPDRKRRCGANRGKVSDRLVSLNVRRNSSNRNNQNNYYYKDI